MAESENLLMREFLSWLSSRRRTYSEAMDAWQSHCPRQTIWEDAMIEGYIELNRRETDQDPEVSLTARGRELLSGNGQHG
ncbi:MAG: hypothetical protein ACM3SP_03435 [Chloroflexota bacterium]